MDWWKNPVLQGEDNDYGDYDYLIEDLTENTYGWENFYQKCDSCGKYHKVNYCTEVWFHTLDGGDSFEDVECWKCVLSDKIYNIRNKIKQRIKIVKEAAEYCKDSKKSFSHCYKLMKKLEEN